MSNEGKRAGGLEPATVGILLIVGFVVILYLVA